MPVGAPYGGASTWFGNSGSTSESITLSSAPTSGDIITIYVYRSNEGTVGTRPNASATGFTNVHHFDPTLTYKGVIDVLVKQSDGSETGAISVAFNEASEYGKALTAWVNAGATTGVTASSAQYDNQTSVTFAAVTGDAGAHGLGNNGSSVDQSSAWPTGDTAIAWATGSWRSAGAAWAGANTTSGSFTAVSGTHTTINYTETATSGPTSTITTIADGADVPPNTDLSSIAIDITGSVNVDNALYTLQRSSNNNYWNGSTWQVSYIELQDTFASTAPPFTHTFTDGPSTLGETDTYTLKAQAQDTDNDWGSFDTNTFTTQAWTYATDHDFTTVAAVNDPPTIVISSPTAAERKVSGTTTITPTGTAADDTSVTLVETSWQVNGGGYNAYQSATGTTSWTGVNITGLVDGDDVDIRARSYDGTQYSVVGTVSATVNTVPVVGSITGIAPAQVLAANAAMPNFTIDSCTDDNNLITRFDYKLANVTDGTWWNGTIWTTEQYVASADTSEATPASRLISSNLPTDLGSSKTYQLRARCRDSENDFSTDEVVNFTTDAAAGPDLVLPTVAFTGPAVSQPVGTTSVDVTGSAADNVLVSLVETRYQINSGGWTGWTAAAGTTAWSATVSGLANSDVLDLEARSTDSSSNVSSPVATRQVTVDTPPSSGVLDAWLADIFTVLADSDAARLQAMFEQAATWLADNADKVTDLEREADELG